ARGIPVILWIPGMPVGTKGVPTVSTAPPAGRTKGLELSKGVARITPGVTFLSGRSRDFIYRAPTRHREVEPEQAQRSECYNISRKLRSRGFAQPPRQPCAPYPGYITWDPSAPTPGGPAP